MPPIIPRCRYSKDLKNRVIYQTTVLSMSPTEIAINLDMPLHVMQHVLDTWDEIGVVVRELQKLGWAHLMTIDDQPDFSKHNLFLNLCELMAAGCVCSY